MVLVDRRDIQSMMDTATVVINSGEQNVQYPFWLRWSELFGTQQIDFKLFGVIKKYSDFTGHHNLQAHAKLLSINGFTVCLLRPIGEFAYHAALVQYVKDASGIHTSDRVSDELNYGNILYEIFKKSTISSKGHPVKQRLLDDDQQEKLQAVDFIINVDGAFIERDIEDKMRRDRINFRVIHECKRF